MTATFVACAMRAPAGLVGGVAGAAGRNTEEGFPLVGFSILPEDVEPAEKGFILERFTVFASQVRNFVEGDDQGVGDQRIGALSRFRTPGDAEIPFREAE